MGKIKIKYLLVMLAAMLCVGPIYQYIATKLDAVKYPAIGKMVDVGGYKLHMLDLGNGSPTVVIDAGLGGSSLDSQLVQPEIAKFTRVISYDRAGYAWSDESPLLRTSENMVAELHTLLKNSQIPGPYILVGYSFGGINMRLFADKYPNEVAGVILVDAAHEDVKSVRTAGLKRQIEEIYGHGVGYFKRFFGIDRLSSNARIKKRIGKFPKDIQQMYLALRLSNKRFRTAVEEEKNFELSCHQLKASGGMLGSKPLVVITAGKKITIEGAGYTQDQLNQKECDKFELQRNLATKSTKGKQIFAEKSGHNVSYDQPEIIVDVVRDMVNRDRL